MIDDKNADEPKYIKVTNLPDDVTAKSLKSFVEAFGRVRVLFDDLLVSSRSNPRYF